MTNKIHKHFLAHKPVKEPTVISFQTKNGPVAFNGRKVVQEPVIVDFDAKKK
jgi:hypothetical protein